MHILEANLSTPVGSLLTRWTKRGLLSCCLLPPDNRSLELPTSSDDVKQISCTHAIDARSRGKGSVVASPQENVTSSADQSTIPLLNHFLSAVDRYFLSGQLDWDLSDLDWSGSSEFQRVVLEACFAIPAGQTCTYAQLAAQVGSPQAARAVGRVMARNRWPLVIPCHRVIGSNGKLTGYSGGRGLATKKSLLVFEAERIQSAKTNVVDNSLGACDAMGRTKQSAAPAVSGFR